MILINGLEMKYLLGEDKIRDWASMEQERLKCLREDTEESRICKVAIGILDGVLND